MGSSLGHNRSDPIISAILTGYAQRIMFSELWDSCGCAGCSRALAGTIAVESHRFFLRGHNDSVKPLASDFLYSTGNAIEAWWWIRLDIEYRYKEKCLFFCPERIISLRKRGNLSGGQIYCALQAISVLFNRQRACCSGLCRWPYWFGGMNNNISTEYSKDVREILKGFLFKISCYDSPENLFAQLKDGERVETCGMRFYFFEALLDSDWIKLNIMFETSKSIQVIKTKYFFKASL